MPFAAAVNQISTALLEAIHGEWWTRAAAQQTLQPSPIGGFDKHPGIDREAAAVCISGHVFGVTGLNVAACHEGAQDAFAHRGLHSADDLRIESSGRMKSHTVPAAFADVEDQLAATRVPLTQQALRRQASEAADQF